MTRDEVISEVLNSFGSLRRPAMFIRGTCKCEECLEHEETMQSFTPDDMPLDKLNNPGWDPICFASDEAFAYFMPGLARLVLDHTDDYVSQFLFHLNSTERLASLSQKQRRALSQLMDFLLLHEAEALDNSLAVDALSQAKEKLEQGK